MNFSGLRRVEILLFVAILVQSLAIIILYEFASQPEVATLNADEEPELAKARDNVDDANSAVSLEGLSEPLGVHHTTPNPGGLILSASFSYRQDPREVNRRKPLPHILPTFENIYHYHTTVLQQGLHAIIFHDDYSFNETFVKKYTSEHIKFVRVEAPTFDHGEPIISPNDFRYVVFDRWLKANSEQDDKGQVIVNGINYGWYMISDLDMIFQRNPFPKLDGYAKLQNVSFFGSYDGGTWENEQMRLQRRLFRNWCVFC